MPPNSAQSSCGADAPVGRFAPSPTGPLHFGSLVAALGSYALAKQSGGRWLLRIEDLDTPRVLPGAEDDILRTLDSFGFAWDGPVIRQSERTDAYTEAFQRLLKMEMIYPCGCSRAEIARSATAPHDGEAELVYPGTCRTGLLPGKEARAWRLRVPDPTITFTDLIQGRRSENLADTCGDFVIKRADGPFAYQLAVVVDDAFQKVNQVVRGADLLSSTFRQIHINRLLGLPLPLYAHLPLITAPDGGKLSKRDMSVSLLSKDFTMQDRRRILAGAAACLGMVIPDDMQGAAPAELLSFVVENVRLSYVPAGPLRAPSEFWSSFYPP